MQILYISKFINILGVQYFWLKGNILKVLNEKRPITSQEVWG